MLPHVPPWHRIVEFESTYVMQRFVNPLLTLLILGCRLSCPLQAAQCADDDADQPHAESCGCCPLERGDTDESPTEPAPNTCQCFCGGAYNLTVQTEIPCPQVNSLAAATLPDTADIQLESVELQTGRNFPPDHRLSTGSALRLLLQSLTC